jgi:hypothetical protein
VRPILREAEKAAASRLMMGRRRRVIVVALATVLAVAMSLRPAVSADGDATAVARGALDGEWFGLFPASAFRVATGRCNDCPVPEAALWYFRDEVIAVPRHGIPISSVSGPSLASGADTPPPAPLAVWIAAPEVVAPATLIAPRMLRLSDGRRVGLATVPKISTNRSYVDDSTFAFFARRPLRLRGSTEKVGDTRVFVARTIWPADARLDPFRLDAAPLTRDEDLAGLVRAQVAGLGSPFAARLLWKATGARPPSTGQAVLAFVLSGAQGDDRGAEAGHVAVATGHIRPDGAWADWLVNNFYPLDQPSEKGIVSAAVPMDNYLADLNSGQAYYRPVYVLVAALRTPAAARFAQRALQTAFVRYYCHEFEFDRAALNSTEMTLEALREVGWQLPRHGPTSRVKAPVAFAAALLAGGPRAARDAFNVFVEERSHLFPRVAFEVAGHDLLDLVNGRTTRPLTAYEQLLARDVEAVAFARFPQIPSSRPFGTYPAGSIAEYRERAGAGQSARGGDAPKSRRFPAELRASCAPSKTRAAPSERS